VVRGRVPWGLAVVCTLVVAAGACGGDASSGDGAAATATSGARSPRGPCVPGRVEVDGVAGRAFCGPATASLTVGTRRLDVSGGSCRADDGSWAANLGTVFPDVAEPPAGRPYVGLTIGAAGSGLELADGTYPDALLTWTATDGATGQGTGTATLSRRRSTAVFEGTSLFTGERILGTIRCGQEIEPG
jgi:hypothetical protein